VQKDGQNQLEKAINAHSLFMQTGVSVPLALRNAYCKNSSTIGDKRMNKRVTVLSLKDDIIKSYDHVYFEWSKQMDIELEVAAWLLNLDPKTMYRC
jgi:hypothetical protein